MRFVAPMNWVCATSTRLPVMEAVKPSDIWGLVCVNSPRMNDRSCESRQRSARILERRQQYDADSIRWSLEKSLARLFSDRLDIVYIHDPSEDPHVDQIFAEGGALEALEQLRQEGVLEAIGLGVRTHRFLRRAIASGRFDAILPSYDFHPLRDSVRPVIEEAREVGMGVVNGSPYNAGLLAGQDLEEALRKRGAAEGDVERARTLRAWCGERGVDSGELAMQYSLRNPSITCTLAGHAPSTKSRPTSSTRQPSSPIRSGASSPNSWKR